MDPTPPVEARYQVGHAEIDRQHAVLFGIIAQVRRLVADEPDMVGSVQVVLDLIKYVIQHFAFEEGQMERSAYPGKDAHLARHREITEQVMSCKERILAGEDTRRLLADFIDTWIKHHIGEEDRRLAKYLAARPA